MLRYSASVDDLETVCCFLDFHETSEEPRNMQKPDIEHLVSGHAVESESIKAFNLIMVEEGYNNPWPCVFDVM